MVRFGLVGLGRWGVRVIDAVAGKTDKFRITHAANRTPGKNAEVASRHSINLLGSFEALLAQPDVDAIVLATPHSQHADQVVAAARAGKPIFVEKPFTLTLADAERALDATRQAGTIVAAGHNRRFMGPVIAMKRAIEAGAVGRILHVEANISGDVRPVYTPAMWRSDRRESPAGGMAGAGIHMIDAMIQMAGPMARVSAISRRLAMPVAIDDTTATLIEFRNGATGTLASIMSTAEVTHLRVMGTNGTVEWRGDDALELRPLTGPATRQDHPRGNSVLADRKSTRLNSSH